MIPTNQKKNPTIQYIDVFPSDEVVGVTVDSGEFEENELVLVDGRGYTGA
jgi:hypothetical protein